MAIAIMIKKTFESLGATSGPKKPWWGHTFCPAIPHCSLCLQLFVSLVIVLLVQHSLQFMPFFLVCVCLFVCSCHSFLCAFVCLFVHAILSCVHLFVCLFMPFFLVCVCLFVCSCDAFLCAFVCLFVHAILSGVCLFCLYARLFRDLQRALGGWDCATASVHTSWDAIHAMAKILVGVSTFRYNQPWASFYNERCSVTFHDKLLNEESSVLLLWRTLFMGGI
jgi:hypothetical protein